VIGVRGYSKDEGIRIVCYNPEWKNMAQSEIEFLYRVLGDGVLIEHFGSTAIPGCCAKDIVDIQIWAEDQMEVERIRAILMPLYQGVSSSESQAKGFLCFDKCVEIDNEIRRTHHIHVRSNFEEWQRGICFRDYLVAHPDAVVRYEQIKQHAAMCAPDDMTEYSRLKGDFINEITVLARKEIGY